MDWNYESTLALIKQYEMQPVLWNSKHGSYYSKLSKQKAWDTIAGNMQLGVNEVRQKINSLLGSFRRERTRLNRGEINSSRWYAFEAMKFLLNRHEYLLEKIFLDDLQTENEDGEGEEYVNFDNDSNLLDEELNEVIGDASNNATRQHTVAGVNDDCTKYGEYLASKLRNYDPKTKAFVVQAINKVIFDADLGKYTDMPLPFDTKQSSNDPEGVETTQQDQCSRSLHLDGLGLEAVNDS